MRGVGVPPGDVPSPSSELQEPPPTPAVPAPAVRPATLPRHPGPGSLLPPVQAATCGGRGGHTPPPVFLDSGLRVPGTPMCPI